MESNAKHNRVKLRPGSISLRLKCPALRGYLGVMRTLLLGTALIFCGPVFFAAAAETNVAATVLWRVALPVNRTLSSPALAPDGTVYLGTLSGELRAYTPTGKVKWRFKAGLEIKSSPAVGADGTVYFGSRDRNAYAVSAAGKLKWKFATGAWVDASPAIAEDGTIYFGSHDKNIYALTPNGKLKWKFDAGGLIASSPAIAADGTIYFGSHDKNFYALTPAGKLKWKFATGGPIDASPTLARDGTVYFTSTDGLVYALAADGTEHWRFRTGSYSASTAVLDEAGNLYLCTSKGFIFIHPDGTSFFTTPSEVPIDASPAVTANREVLVSIPWLCLGTFHRDHPWPPYWRYQMDSNLETSPNVDTNGIIYGCTGSFLYAIKPPFPAPPEKSAWPLWRANPQNTGRIAK